MLGLGIFCFFFYVLFCYSDLILVMCFIKECVGYEVVVFDFELNWFLIIYVLGDNYG